MKHIKPFRPFRDMIYLGIPDASIFPSESDMQEILPEKARARLFLGIYDENSIKEAIERFSIQQKLNELGLGKYRIIMNTSNPDYQELKILPVNEANTGRSDNLEIEPIAEIILREALLGIPFDNEKTKSFPFLVVQWIRLQNPRATFDPETLLPGQKFPGLGVGSKVMQMLKTLIERLHLVGVVNRPEFIHNAIIYSKSFKFLNPEAQGRLIALQRDLKEMNLWQIAWAVFKGFVIEDEKTNFFNWFQSEQIMSGCPELESYFSRKHYINSVIEVANNASYRLSEKTPEKYRQSSA